MSDFLLEIGLEEVPARMIAGAETELGKRVNDLLTRERLLAPGAKLTTYSTPRRLAVLAEGVLAKQADTEEQLTGPSWKVAFQDGAPTPAAQAFAKKAGVAVDDLKKVETPKGEYVGATVKRPGRAAGEILASELPKEVLAIYWAKNMYWRAAKPERFVRPVRWVLALMDSAVVPLEIAGIAAGNTSRGHRVLHGEAPVTIASANAYKETLRAAFVIADVAERRQIVRKALDAATRTVPGARWREDKALVETVTHLAEWPSVILGDFEPEYLELPEEVLVTVMRDHQKYFAVEDANGKLAPHFLAVLNTQADQEGAAIVRHGNARVLRARFKDARFFWDFDQKTPLTERVESLKNVTFQQELGSYFWKTEQNLAVAQRLAESVKDVGAGYPYSLGALGRAVTLAKTDLTTELVKEFTELQGIIGGLYALEQNHGETVATAIKEQYTPSSMEDPIPTSTEGQLLGLADRIQTITAMFGIGYAPTGSKDPFALRRAANGIVKILAESKLQLNMSDVLAAAGQGGPEMTEFFRERLSFYLRDFCGFAYDVVNAVMASGVDDVRDAIKLAEAITSERGSADFIAICVAFKRIKNILRQASQNNETIPSETPLDTALVEAEEKNLLKASQSLAIEVAVLRRNRNFKFAIKRAATLGPVVAAFFEKVMVMVPDPEVRAVRLGLIRAVLVGFSSIADFSEIVTA